MRVQLLAESSGAVSKTTAKTAEHAQTLLHTLMFFKIATMPTKEGKIFRDSDIFSDVFALAFIEYKVLAYSSYSSGKLCPYVYLYVLWWWE